MLSPVTERNGHTALLFIGALFGFLAFRALLLQLLSAWGASPGGMFFNPDDRFADLLKTGLTFKFIVAKALAAHEYTDWPPIFQQYLLDNSYNSPAFSHIVAPPLATLMAIFGGLLAVNATPTVCYEVFVVFYASLAVGLAALFHPRKTRGTVPLRGHRDCIHSAVLLSSTFHAE